MNSYIEKPPTVLPKAGIPDSETVAGTLNKPSPKKPVRSYKTL